MSEASIKASIAKTQIILRKKLEQIDFKIQSSESEMLPQYVLEKENILKAIRANYQTANHFHIDLDFFDTQFDRLSTLRDLDTNDNIAQKQTILSSNIAHQIPIIQTDVSNII